MKHIQTYIYNIQTHYTQFTIYKDFKKETSILNVWDDLEWPTSQNLFFFFFRQLMMVAHVRLVRKNKIITNPDISSKTCPYFFLSFFFLFFFLVRPMSFVAFLHRLSVCAVSMRCYLSSSIEISPPVPEKIF